MSSRWIGRAFATVAFVLTVLVVAFLTVWAASWSVEPDRFENARAWWSEVAAPRAGWSLLVGIPVGVAVAFVVRRWTRRLLE
jgi:hypothetical protein